MWKENKNIIVAGCAVKHMAFYTVKEKINLPSPSKTKTKKKKGKHTHTHTNRFFLNAFLEAENFIQWLSYQNCSVFVEWRNGKNEAEQNI